MGEALRYGLIGTGMMGIEHLRNLQHVPGASITAIADPHEPSRGDALEVLGPDAEGVQVFEHHRDLVASGACDAVVISSPNHTHVDVLLDVLTTDLHVLVEKPLCTTVADCRRVLAAAEGRDALTWVGLEYRYMAPVQRLVHEVRAGTVGRLRMVAIREHRFPFLRKVGDWNRFSRNTGGTLVEKCCHFFDLMHLITGSTAARVMASGGQDVNHLDEVYGGEVPDLLDNAYVVVDFESGARGLLDLCMFAEATHSQEEIVVVGDAGKVEALVPQNEVRVGRRGEHWIGGVEHHDVVDERVAYEGFHHGSSYLEHLDFLQAVRTGAPPAVTLRDGMLAVAVGVAAHRSIDTGAPVRMVEVLAEQ